MATMIRITTDRKWPFWVEAQESREPIRWQPRKGRLRPPYAYGVPYSARRDGSASRGWQGPLQARHDPRLLRFLSQSGRRRSEGARIRLARNGKARG